MNENGTSNTITSVQKDNLVVEPRIIEVGKVKEGKHQQDFVQHEGGICRTICTGHHASTPHLLKPMVSEPLTDGVSNTLTSVQKDNYLAIPEATRQGYAAAHEGDSVNLAVPNSKTRRGRVGKQMANTLDTGCQQGVVEADSQVKYCIRKLTPRECFRLMGVDDEDIDKLMSAGISNSQLYKCAGNSIVVDTLYHLFRKLFVDKDCEKPGYQQMLF